MGSILCFFKPHNNYRNYARMDSNGLCIGFKQCDRNPGGQWVQVEEITLAWLTKTPPVISGPTVEQPHLNAQ